MLYYPGLTRVLPSTTIRCERILPVEGEVLVHAGAQVESLSVIARAEVAGRYRILNVSQALKVPPETVAKYIRRRPGQQVEVGQVVARRRVGWSLLPRVVRAPESGVVAAVGGGRVLLESVGEPIELRAWLPGRIREVIPKTGVLIETIGALIQGMWGSGGESFGVLKVLAEGPNQRLEARSIDVSCHGAVLVGGSTMDREALQQALELQVRGIIVGSLKPGLLEMARRVPFPIIVTEGVGQAPMARPIFDLLSIHDGREAAVNGHSQQGWNAVRPEVVIPLPAQSAPPPPLRDTPLDVGARVRVMRGPVMGAVGTVRHLPTQPLVLETGARVWGATVVLDGGEEQSVPLLNLELLG